MKKNPIDRTRIWLFLLLIPLLLSAQVTRQPYLQLLTPTSVTIRWQSGTRDIGTVYYGTSVSSLSATAVESENEKIYHDVLVTGLTPNTRYYYSVEGKLKGNQDQYFTTSPEVGGKTPVRIWVISDFGQSNSRQNGRRLETVAQWKSFNKDSYSASFLLSLGDQTEDDATFQIQHNYFDQLEPVLKTTALFTATGNHDFHDGARNYVSTFTTPAHAEAGGVASGTPFYYSFDYSNVHIVVLCTEIEDAAGRGEQIAWLKKDLNSNKQEWLIACMHRPFHSGGHHRSDMDPDAQVRRNDWLRILEDHGVDLVLQGHNHVYERTYLLDNLVGKTTTVSAVNKINAGLGREGEDGPYRKKKGLPHQGTVFVEVAPGGVPEKDYEHYSIFPIYYVGDKIEGSVVVDVNGNRLDVKFLCDEPDAKGSHVWDNFTIMKTD